MNKLILLPSDVPATGKSTFARCLSRYLDQCGVAHHSLAMNGTALASLQPQHLRQWFESATVVILDLATGSAAAFARHFVASGWAGQLVGSDISLTVAVPVNGDPDSFEPVLEAVEAYADNAEYVIVHVGNDDENAWERSYAARVMEMFGAVEIDLPQAGAELMTELRARRLSLAQGPVFPLLSKWLQPALAQIDSARRVLFGEALRALPAKRSEPWWRSRVAA
jgi:hypothetical protein